MMSAVFAKSTSGLRSTSALSGIAASSSVRTSLSEPLPARPIGVRMASMITASGMPRSYAGDRLGGEPGAGVERRPRRGGPGAQEPGGERVAGAGGVDHVVDGERSHGDRLDPVGPGRAVGAVGDDQFGH